MGANIEGPAGANVTDALKYQCTNCNGVKLSFATAKRGVGEGTEGVSWLCLQCGYEGICTFTSMGALGNYSD